MSLEELNIDGYFAQESPTRIIPKDKMPKRLPGDTGTVASNSGVLDVACYINRVCPFKAADDINDTLIFNQHTMKDTAVVKNLMVEFVEGEDGFFLSREVPYRHNFITAKKRIGDGEPIPEDLDEELGIPNNIEAIYKTEQQWEIVPSVFSNNFLRPSEYSLNKELLENAGFNCGSLPIWQYELINKEVSSEDTDGNSILMMKQVANSFCKGVGIHWRLDKKTPLFKGEDFFIEFHRRALSTDISNFVNLSNDESENRLQWKDKEYESLNSNSKIRNKAPEYNNQILPANLGVANRDENSNIINPKTYDFRDQAYYVVELGKGDPENNFFILITQRGFIRCIKKQNNRTTLISEYAGASGIELLESDWLRMTVRNHLGKLVVEFKGKGFQYPPWVISNFDIAKKNKNIGNQEIPKFMFVPHGRVSVWGGNMLSGFIFGPLQYHQSRHADDLYPMSFRLPFKNSPFEKETRGDDALVAISGSTEGEDASDNFFTLPYKSKKSIRLTPTDQPIQDIYNGSLSANNRNNRPKSNSQSSFRNMESQSYTKKNNNDKITDILFTQDAQLYQEVINDDEKEFEGSFFKAPPLKELSNNEEDALSTIRISMVDGVVDGTKETWKFRSKIEMKAGDHTFYDEDGNVTWTLKRCKTPVMSLMRLVSSSLEESRWEARGFECSSHITSFRDNWAAQNYTSIDHSGSIQFLLNNGVKFHEDDRTEDLLNLRNKAFYIEVWAGYKKEEAAPTSGGLGNRPGTGLNPELGDDQDPSLVAPSNSEGIGCNYSKLPAMFRVFTGIAYGGNVTYEYGKRVMDCTLHDYTHVLKDILFFNSPFFDGMKDINAINEILGIAGFKDQETTDPKFLINRCAKENDNEQRLMIGPDGRIGFYKSYALPSGYSRLTQPQFKFKDGDNLHSAITKIAQRSGKVFFFDSYGVARYENYVDTVIDQLNSRNQSEETGETSVLFKPVFWFTTNHRIWAGQLVFNSMSIMEDVESVYNHIKILTNTPDFTPIFTDDISYPSVNDPEVEGFIGYLKSFYQAEGSFGSKESATEIRNFYKAMRRPPYVVQFETYGQPIRALDIVSLNGQALRVMRVDSTLDPQSNRWWQKVECEWLKEIEVTGDPVSTVYQEEQAQSTGDFGVNN